MRNLSSNPVTSDSPSFPLNTMFSVSGACRPNDELVTRPISVPASLNIISTPSSSNIISPLASTVKSPVLVIVSIAGLVRVLFVNVSEPANLQTNHQTMHY